MSTLISILIGVGTGLVFKGSKSKKQDSFSTEKDKNDLISSCGDVLKDKRLKSGYNLVNRKKQLK
jgi:hypothetical protein